MEKGSNLPTTFLDLLNNTYDDADLVQLLANDLTAQQHENSEIYESENIDFNQQVLEENHEMEMEEDEEEGLDDYMADDFMNINSSMIQEAEDEELMELEDEENFGRLLSEAQAIGKDLTTGDSLPHLWQNLEKEWTEFNRDLRITSGIGKIRRSRSGPRIRTLSPTLKTLLGEANLHYVNKDYPKAIEVLQEVVKIDPNIHIAWFTLGTIQDEMGCPEKALQLYLVAAHLTPNDGSLWKRLGLLSKCDHHDEDAIWDRSILYAEIGEYKKALDGFRGLLKEMPYDMNVIRELTRIHVQLNEIPQAIELFNDAYKYYRSNPISEDPVSEGGFGYSEINIMAELYMLANDFNSAIDFIKRGVRWLQGREDEVWWDTVADDREYDEDENANRRENSILSARLNGVVNIGGTNAPLPLELRVKSGQCRIELEQLEEGKLHFTYLEFFDVENYVDLYYEVAETYAEKGLYEDALGIYEAIVSNEKTDSPTAWLRMGICHRELGNLESAVEHFIVEEMPDDLDAKMALAESYESLGENSKALEMVNSVLEVRRKQRAVNEAKTTQEYLSSINPQSGEDNLDHSITTMDHDSSLINQISESSKASAYAKAQEERRRKEAEKEKELQIQYHRLELLYSRYKDGDQQSANEFLEGAKVLFAEFKNHKPFYPRDKMVPYKGFDRRRCWRRQMALKSEIADDGDDAALEEQATTMAKRLQWQIDGEIGEIEAEIRKRMVEFQEAFDVLRIVSRANVFYHNDRQKTGFKLLLLAWGLYTRNYLVVCESSRWLCNNKPFNSKVYNLYDAGMSSGTNALSCYAAANSQKYFLRQVKLMDTGGYDPRQGGKRREIPDKKNEALLALYGHILACARSYIGAIGYYARAYARKPKDPVVSLSMGLAYLHRALQRQSDNRHIQVVQVKIITERENFKISLTHLAISHYEKALKLPSLLQVINPKKDDDGDNGEDETDLRKEAAYNLSLIYNESGSPGLAATLLRKYCTI
ncbi:3084_t:CDS:10 [Diversispora eburnea]|uniref:3084_t:CDS:1 n=1 Tax=Diversispora eburnea TaxID=1213867 RepID=A0A9N8YRI2_9GLOM|nr:3084_t:CDS:10 [Diversispora eburnea]